MMLKLFKIPKNIKALVCKKTQLLVLFSMTNTTYFTVFIKTRSFLLKNNYLLLFYSRKWVVKNNPTIQLVFRRISSFFKNYTTKIKLELKGIGYKFFLLERKWGVFLQLKVGFSHSLFFKLPLEIKVILIKPTLIFFIGRCFNTVMSLVTEIRNLKFPEPYKGKGILFANESVLLKPGKKE